MAEEETFLRVLGTADWAVMFILAREGQSYASLRFHVGPGGTVPIPVCVDYSRPFAARDRAAWEEEYLASASSSPTATSSMYLSPAVTRTLPVYPRFCRASAAILAACPVPCCCFDLQYRQSGILQLAHGGQ